MRAILQLSSLSIVSSSVLEVEDSLPLHLHPPGRGWARRSRVESQKYRWSRLRVSCIDEQKEAGEIWLDY